MKERRRQASNSRGEMNVLVVPFMFLFLFFVCAAAFGLWAYNGREDYRKHTDQKIAAAVNVAKQQEDVVKDKEHAEADKQPLKTYVGPEQFGSLHISYPKTWSGYVIESTNNGASQPVDGYFQPGVVPDVNDQNSIFALRVQVLNQSYTAVTQQYNQQVTSGTLTASPYAFPHVSNDVGIRYDGTINQNKKVIGNMVVVPLRDKTLLIWTESPSYLADLNNNILPNVTFSP